LTYFVISFSDVPSNQKKEEEKEKEDTSSRRGIRSLLYTHPERSDPEAGMQEIIDLTGGLKLSRTEAYLDYMDYMETEGLNEIMNEDDLDSEEEEFRFELSGMGASINYVDKILPTIDQCTDPLCNGLEKTKVTA
jgi:hypothetical protein